MPPDLQKLLQKDEQKRFLRQAGIALIALTLVLGGVAFAVPHLYAEKPAPLSDATIASTTPEDMNAYANVHLIGKAAIVYDLTDGHTLYAQNANAQLPLASITKLLTLYAASDSLAPNSPVTMTSTALAKGSDAADIGFVEGEVFTFDDLARLTLAASSNVGAEAITETATAHRAMSTASLLASAASAAGLSQTYAVNGTGLDESTELSGGYGSAQDVAKLAGALLMKIPDIAHASAEPVVSASSADGILHTFKNTDKDVGLYPGLLLSKTGYTDLAGGNLVIVYDAGIHHPVAIVVLGSTQSGRFADVESLMEATMAHFAGVTPS